MFNLLIRYYKLRLETSYQCAWTLNLFFSGFISSLPPTCLGKKGYVVVVVVKLITMIQVALEINFVCYNNVSLYDIKNFHLIGISMCGLCLCEMSVYAFGYTISRRLKQKHGCTLIGFVGWEAHTHLWPYVSTCAHGCLHSLLFVYECSVVVVKLILPKDFKGSHKTTFPSSNFQTYNLVCDECQEGMFPHVCTAY